MAKLARAQYHARFAEWLAERTGEELVEIRAYHLDQAVEFLTELEGAPPEELAQETAAALVKAAKRAIAREAYANARTLGLRALELGRRSARATSRRARRGGSRTSRRSRSRWRRFASRRASSASRVIEALALTALGEAALKRDGDPDAGAGARRRGARDPGARRTTRSRASTRSSPARSIGAWHGDMDEVVRYMERAYALAMDAGRKDLQTIAAQVLAQTHIVRLELDEAELLLTRALELAGESGSVRARVGATLSYGWFLAVKGELDAAETVFEEVRADGDRARRRARRSRRRSCGSVRSRGDRRRLPTSREALPRGAPHHVDPRRPWLCCRTCRRRSRRCSPLLGKVDEAERLALEAAGERRGPTTPHFERDGLR